jgi:hypothetical protein
VGLSRLRRRSSETHGMGLAGPVLEVGAFWPFLWVNLLFLSHFNFLQLIMYQDRYFL